MVEEASEKKESEQQQEETKPEQVEAAKAQDAKEQNQETPEEDPIAEKNEETLAQPSLPDENQPMPEPAVETNPKEGALEEKEETTPSEEKEAESKEEETPSQEPEAPVIAELDVVCEHVKETQKTTKKLTSAIQDEGQPSQKLFKPYSAHLAHIPTILQLLNDYRRHTTDIKKRAEEAEKTLVKLRGGDADGITSEEARVFLAAHTAKETLLSSITSFESALSIVRNSTHSLLSLISYDRDGYEDYARQTIPLLQAENVEEILSTEFSRLSDLRNDMKSLEELEDHIKELQNGQ